MKRAEILCWGFGDSKVLGLWVPQWEKQSDDEIGGFLEESRRIEWLTSRTNVIFKAKRCR
ncbi:hypothetical protein H5410_019180 [Solanum commersonii]|uniref:Uncharacterized protein n=1 Tax=Solanum commersonii TaxID=4109 RepID=A0A9J6A588_SOLCO|nr:hypothetical protein H5410_019180 [Solanum commersonii]